MKVLAIILDALCVILLPLTAYLISETEFLLIEGAYVCLFVLIFFFAALGIIVTIKSFKRR